MTIQYCSDLHLELRENEAYLKAHPIQPAGDVLLLAGDIVPFALMKRCSWFFDFLSDSFEAVYWVPGNHEYYGSDFLQRSGRFTESVRRNIFLLNNEAVSHAGVTLIFSTLWSAISPDLEWDIARRISDYAAIRRGTGRFRPQHSNVAHRESRAFLERAIAQGNGPVIFATHHVPTLLNYPEQYRGSALNHAFATELFSFIETSAIDAWIYGHHHNNTPEFSIGTTRMLTNQLGYVSYGEHEQFNGNATIAAPLPVPGDNLYLP